MRKIKVILKLFYYMFPSIIRNQYQDSRVFYKSILHRFQKKYFLTTVKEIQSLSCPIKNLYQKEDRYSTVGNPKLYFDNKYYQRESLEGEVPDINVYLLSDIEVVGWTDAIIYNNKMYHNELNNMKDIHDLKRWDIFSKVKDTENEYRLTIKKVEEGDDSTIYISLLKEHSINYYHFVTEGLPRLITIMSVLEKSSKIKMEECTILIDEEMPSQCIEILKSILHENVTIREVGKGHKLKCKQLIYCTPLWVSLDNTTNLPNPKKEFFVDKFALKIVREKILELIVDKKIPKLKNKKIYLQRVNTKLRPINNILEVEKLLYKYDFNFVDTGSLSFFEQLVLFSQAEMILGVSGASFTNMLFMKEGSVAISFYPSAQSTNYYVFQPLADTSNTNFVHFLTTPGNDSNSVHADASIDIDNLNFLLEELP